jgi:hypothetical protein
MTEEQNVAILNFKKAGEKLYTSPEKGAVFVQAYEDVELEVKTLSEIEDIDPSDL